ncbi:MAG: hypothetical protein ACTSWE_03945 [Promethearchaeota archaeon]
MPSVSWHKQKQIHDLNLNVHINKTILNYEDWKIITLFYSLLHTVDEYLGEYPRNIHPSTHYDRNIEINNHLHSIRKDYRIIKTISEDARYQKNMTKKEFINFLKKYANLKKYLTPVKCAKCGLVNRLNAGKCRICKNPL